MPFRQDEVEHLLVECHRRCCICHRFCGVKMELDHALPSAEGGTDDIDNAIPVCFECHAEINSYNDDHPRGRKFRSDEKKKHKDQWLRICRENPGALIAAPRNSDVGPIQAMIDELEYNACTARQARTRSGSYGTSLHRVVGHFRDEEFGRAIATGAISILNDELRESLLTTYAAIGELKELIAAITHQSNRDAAGGYVDGQVREVLRTLPEVIMATHDLLLGFLGRESNQDE